LHQNHVGDHAAIEDGLAIEREVVHAVRALGAALQVRPWRTGDFFAHFSFALIIRQLWPEQYDVAQNMALTTST
jgi:hypothetical protein